MTKKTANAIVKSANPEFLCCISDICHNILQDKVKLSAKQKDLKKYKHQLRKIADKATTNISKRQPVQKGGFLGAILAPLIGSVIEPLVKSFQR